MDTATEDPAAADCPVADAHHHLWSFAHGRYPWLQNEYDAGRFFLGDYRALCQDFLPAHYRAASAGCNVVATVHIEAERDRGEQVAETAWLHAQHADWQGWLRLRFAFPQGHSARVPRDLEIVQAAAACLLAEEMTP